MSQPLEFIEINTADNPTHAVIWLHGLGASADDFVDIIPLLNLPVGIAIRFIFPNAPQIAVTINGGYVMPAWYDILEMSLSGRKLDQAGIKNSVAQIHQLILQQNQQGIAADHILLAGFSQGGAIAYQTALTYPERLAGLIALSTYIPDAEGLQRDFKVVQQQLPVFAAHGLNDDVVAIDLGKQAYNLVQKLGGQAVWYQYPMAHNVCAEQITDIGKWLSAQLSHATTKK